MNWSSFAAGVCVAVLMASSLFGQSPPPPQEAEIVTLPTGDRLLCWFAHAGRTYFIETSDPNFPLGAWAWCPLIEEGNDVLISHEVESTADKAFFRLHHTDLPRPPGVTPEDWDADGDGLSNWSEIGLHGTNPLKVDTSGDGLPDGWVIAHGLAPLINNASGLFQDSQSTNLQAYHAGVQAVPNANLANFDGDRADNEEDADPHDPVIDWAPSPKPVFAIVELDIEDVENVTLDDFTRSGTLLFTHYFEGYPETDDYPYERIVVDRSQTVHTFAASNWGLEGAPFWGYGSTLIGEKVLGMRIVNGFSQESLWDSQSNIFTPYQAAAPYHDDIRDHRNGVTIWDGPDQTGAAWGLRKSPGGQLLPGAAALAEGGIDGRIEEHGNIISNASYWRWNMEVESFDQPVNLPESSMLRSATLIQVQKGGELDREWNLVAGLEGLMVSSDRNPFLKASGTTGSEAVHGVTRQGWVIDRNADRIWTNGEWHFFKEYLGSPSFKEVELLDILDTGLAVVKIRRTSSDPLRIALLLPMEVVAHQRGTINVPGQKIPRPVEGDYEAVTIENGDLDQFDNAANARALTPADADNADLQDAKKNRVATEAGGNFGAVALATDDDFIKVYIDHGIPDDLKFDAELELVEVGGTRRISKGQIFLYTKEGKSVDITTLKFTDSAIPSSGAMHDLFDKDRGLFVELGDLGELASRAEGPAQTEQNHFKEITLSLKAKIKGTDINLDVKVKILGASPEAFQKSKSICPLCNFR